MKNILKVVGVLVLLLLVLLFAFAYRMVDSSDRANQKEFGIVAPRIAQRISLFMEDCGRFPTMAEGLPVFLNPKAVCPQYSGDSCKRVENDPWGRPYVYELKDDGTAFDLVSYGKDGKPGGSGYDQDIRWSELGGNH